MNLPPFPLLAVNNKGLRGKFEPVSERIGDFYSLSLSELTEEEVDKKSSLQLTIPWTGKTLAFVSPDPRAIMALVPSRRLLNDILQAS